MVSDGTPVLDDRYALEAVVGRGGMADVYSATDTVLEREVAVKLLPTLATPDSDRTPFRDEAKILAALDPPNLVTILDAGLCDDVPYLVMDLIDGDSLAPFCHGSAIP